MARCCGRQSFLLVGKCNYCRRAKIRCSSIHTSSLDFDAPKTCWFALVTLDSPTLTRGTAMSTLGMSKATTHLRSNAYASKSASPWNSISATLCMKNLRTSVEWCEASEGTRSFHSLYSQT